MFNIPRPCAHYKNLHNSANSTQSDRAGLVPTAIVLQSGRQVSDSDTAALQMSLGRWQPDFMAISYSTYKIAIGPEVCRQSDTHAENLFEAYSKGGLLRFESNSTATSDGGTQKLGNNVWHDSFSIATKVCSQISCK